MIKTKFSSSEQEKIHQIMLEIDEETVEFLWNKVKSRLPITNELAASEAMLYLNQRIAIKIICSVFSDKESRKKGIEHHYTELKRLLNYIKTVQIPQERDSPVH